MISNSKHEGFTLVEMIIVIVILSIVIAGSTPILIQQFQLFNTGQEILNADWQGRIGLNRIVREIRSTDNITDAKTDEISFHDDQNNTITYKIVNNQLIEILPGSQAPLADNVGNLDLHYYDQDNNELTPPLSNAERDAIRYLTITLNIFDRTTNINLTTAVFLWNKK